jgi:glutamate-1-semialdehyde 2,1-aminomutase
MTTQTTDTMTRRSEESERCFERARRVLVGGVNSPVRAFGAVGGHPVFLQSAEGAHVTDVDVNRYIDLVGSWGPAIVGHAHPQVLEAVQAAAARGLSFGACCEAESILAETIVEALPSVDLVRFVNSGTEATMSAVRLARAATGRTKILKFLGCYHGHVDALLVAAGSGAATFGVPDSAGVPAETAAPTLLAPYNDLEAVRAIVAEHGADLAAILVEPIAGNMGYIEPADGFLEGLRTLCDDTGVLLVFDEVMTGFRVAWGGQQVRVGIRPDLTCLGKVIGGGMPVAAYGGRSELMEHVSPLGPMYQAGTLSGNPLGMASGEATLRLCGEPGFYEELSRRAVALADGLRAAATGAGVHVRTGSTGGMLGLSFSDQPVRDYDGAKACDHAAFGRFFHAMLERGVWLPPSSYEAMFISAAHGDDVIEQLLEAAAASFEVLVA